MATGMTARIPLFVSLTATGWDDRSFPVEIAWCDSDGRGELHLIHPPPDRLGWSDGLRRALGVSREQLELEGREVKEVADRVASAFTPKKVAVVSNYPAFHHLCLNRLLVAGGLRARIRLYDLWRSKWRTVAAILRGAGVPDCSVPDLKREIAEALRHADEVRGPPGYRALPEAQRDASGWTDALRLAQEIAARWRQASPTAGSRRS
jgi:hypothetical protein